jgi:hypothetical protein
VPSLLPASAYATPRSSAPEAVAAAEAINRALRERYDGPAMKPTRGVGQTLYSGVVPLDTAEVARLSRRGSKVVEGYVLTDLNRLGLRTYDLGGSDEPARDGSAQGVLMADRRNQWWAPAARFGAARGRAGARGTSGARRRPQLLFFGVEKWGGTPGFGFGLRAGFQGPDPLFEARRRRQNQNINLQGQRPAHGPKDGGGGRALGHGGELLGIDGVGWRRAPLGLDPPCQACSSMHPSSLKPCLVIYPPPQQHKIKQGRF